MSEGQEGSGPGLSYSLFLSQFEVGPSSGHHVANVHPSFQDQSQCVFLKQSEKVSLLRSKKSGNLPYCQALWDFDFIQKEASALWAYWPSCWPQVGVPSRVFFKTPHLAAFLFLVISEGMQVLGGGRVTLPCHPSSKLSKSDRKVVVENRFGKLKSPAGRIFLKDLVSCFQKRIVQIAQVYALF